MFDVAKALEVSEKTSTAASRQHGHMKADDASGCARSTPLLALARDRNKPLWTGAEHDSPNG